MRAPNDTSSSSHAYVSLSYGMTYAERVRRWAESLSETDVRSLAADYRSGSRDEACIDAAHELARRASKGLLKGRALARCPEHAGKHGRRPANCDFCNGLLPDSIDPEVVAV